MITATRFHDFCYGHRVHGHEGKCANLHGHGGRVHFTVAPLDGATLDPLGRVIDFGVINTHLCQWVEQQWDHRFLLSDQDPLATHLKNLSGVCLVDFNPTAENMAQYLLNVIGPRVLALTSVRLIQVRLDETRKCSATVTSPEYQS